MAGAKLTTDIKPSPENFRVLVGSMFKMIHIHSLRGENSYTKSPHKVTTNEMRKMVKETTYNF